MGNAALGKAVALLKLIAEGVPNAGVVKVGLAIVVANVEAPVMVPDPLIVIVMFVPYTTVQTEPVAMVTVIPLATVTGPALMPL